MYPVAASVLRQVATKRSTSQCKRLGTGPTHRVQVCIPGKPEVQEVVQLHPSPQGTRVVGGKARQVRPDGHETVTLPALVPSNEGGVWRYCPRTSKLKSGMQTA